MVDATTSTSEDRSIGRGLRFAGIVWLASRGYFLAAAGLMALLHRLPSHPGTPAQWPFTVYSRFDAGHFVRIARQGYFATDNGAPAHDEAFFPGYPLAARFLAQLVGAGSGSDAPFLVAMSLITSIGALVSAVLLWKLTAEVSTPTVAHVAVAVLLFGPYSVFLMASYSEAPFLAFALAAWLLARNGRWWAASAAASVACVIKVNGLFLVAGLLVMYCVSIRQRGRRAVRLEVVSFALPLFATASYFWWLHTRTGSWTTWFDEERAGWGRERVAPWTALANSVGQVFTAGTPHVQSCLELIFAALLVGCLIVLGRRGQWPELTYVGLTAAALLTSTHYLSVPRSLLVCFPAIVVIAQWLRRPGSRSLRWAAIAGATGVLLLNTFTFMTDRWTG